MPSCTTVVVRQVPKGFIERETPGRAAFGGGDPPHVHAGARRDPCRLDPGHHGQPRRVRLGVGRRHLGQRLLRPLRLPHHHAAHEGVDPVGDDPAARLLGPTGPAAPACPLRPPRRHRPLRLVLRPGRHTVTLEGGRPRHLVLRGQLAPDPRRPELLRAGLLALSAAPHLDAGHRGAVLPRVAARGPRRPQADPFASRPLHRRRRRRARLGDGDGPPLPRRPRPEPAVLRDRHPRPGHPHRSGHGHPALRPPGGDGPASEDRALGHGRRRRLLSSSSSGSASTRPRTSPTGSASCWPM